MAKITTKNCPLYRTWNHIKSRCNNPRVREYRYYGKRGIGYDPKWESFANFQEDMGNSYRNGLSIDRIDNNKDYSKENCRWATSVEQNNNRRDNRLFSYKGITDNLLNWSRVLGIKLSTLKQRYYGYGWSIEKTLSKGMDI